MRPLDDVISSINGWYMERGLFALVSGVEFHCGGILSLCLGISRASCLRFI
ncbi:hypothetical protein HanIR_Chr12g0570951 [Helianthus annuus]|nr:hypothetical protein HanIR_Chr12g0570951 [Helianthus annuus]